MPTLTVNTQLTPRVVQVSAPDTEISVQELHDLLRAWEDSADNADNDVIISSAGKEPLGGGVSVGVTSTLQNAVLAFEARINLLSADTITTPGSGGSPSLIASGATFVSDGVARGDLVHNITDGSWASVVRVVSETEIITDELTGGTDNDYDVSDNIEIFDVTQCNISGGNLVAVDENGADITAVLPTFGTQVVRTSAASATLLNQLALEHGSFDGAVWVNESSNYVGTIFPTGTLLQPVNNWADALTIATEKGFTEFRIIGAATLPATGDFTGKKFKGATEAVPFTITAGATVDNCSYEVLQLSGPLGGVSLIRDVLIVAVTNFNGIAENSVIAQSVHCTGSGDTLFINCYSSVDVVAVPTVSFGGASGPDTVFRGYVGDIKITDLSRANAKISMDFESGDVEIDSTITNGTIVIRGIGTVTDNSNSAATVISNIINAENVNNSLYDGGVTVDAINGQAGTAFPLGTRSAPVDNLADAKTIAANESLREIRFLGNYTFGATDVLDDYIIRGEGVEATLFTLTAGVTTDNALFLDADLTGTLSGYTRARDCELKTSVSNLEGLFENCIFRVGTFTLVQDNTKLFVANNCKSGVVTGQPQPIFDCNGDGASFIVRAWSGPYKVINKTAATSGICFDFVSGKLVLDSTITAGHFPVRGTVYVLNQMTGTATAELEGVGSAFQNADFIWDEDLTTHTSADSAGLYVSHLHGHIPRGVFINTEELTNGNGYQQDPYNNWSDAVDAAEAELLRTLYLEADATVDRNLSNFEIQGLDLPAVDLAGFDFKNVIIRECDVTGAQGTGQSPLLLLTCNMTNISDFNGSCLTVTAVGSIGVADSGFVLINELVPFVAGASVTLDMQAGAAGSTANFQNLSGDFTLTNVDHASDVVTVYMRQGSLTIDATCTAGTINVGGNVNLTDNSGIGCTVNDNSIGTDVSEIRADVALLEKIFTNDVQMIEEGDGSRTVRIFDDDDVTILKEFTISADRLQRTENI